MPKVLVATLRVKRRRQELLVCAAICIAVSGCAPTASSAPTVADAKAFLNTANETSLPSTIGQNLQGGTLGFPYASFLLGADPTVTAYLNFQDEHGLYGGSQYYAWWNAALGSATGAYSKIGNCYVRTFTKGKAVVNPTTSACSFNLGGTDTDVTGSRVTTASLPSHTAGIYTAG